MASVNADPQRKYYERCACDYYPRSRGMTVGPFKFKGIWPCGGAPAGQSSDRILGYVHKRTNSSGVIAYDGGDIVKEDNIVRTPHGKM